MAPRRSAFDDKLDRLRELAALPAMQAAPELRRLLAEPNAYLVNEAARITAELELPELVPDLVAAFQRILAGPASADKGCHCKNRLVESLMRLDANTPEVYLAGLKHVQMEFSVPLPVDAASALRGLSAHALVRMDHPDAAFLVAPLLLDPEPNTRAAAADALAVTGEELCGAVLHVKMLAGDSEAEVRGACYRGMLALAPRRYLPVVTAELAKGEEAAAIALGESRQPEALPALKKALETGGPQMQDSVLLGIALLRSEVANAFLLELVAQAPEVRAIGAVEALALHRHDARLVARVREAAAPRRSRRLAKAIDEKLGREGGG
jgi:HEAT repeat protein